LTDDTAFAQIIAASRQGVLAEGTTQLSDVSTTPGDTAGRELLELHTAFYGELDEDRFFDQMVADQRLVIRLRVERLYGVALDRPPGA